MLITPNGRPSRIVHIPMVSTRVSILRKPVLRCQTTLQHAHLDNQAGVFKEVCFPMYAFPNPQTPQTPTILLTIFSTQFELLSSPPAVKKIGDRCAIPSAIWGFMGSGVVCVHPAVEICVTTAPRATAHGKTGERALCQMRAETKTKFIMSFCVTLRARTNTSRFAQRARVKDARMTALEKLLSCAPNKATIVDWDIPPFQR